MDKLPVVAAFDFDGTITYSDSLLSFFIFTHGYLQTFLNIISSLPTLFAFLFGLKNRQQTKERLLTKFYKGRSLAEMQNWGNQYVEQGIKVKPEAIERLHWHQQQGHRCVLVSASLDVYLKFWGSKMGFSNVLCSHLETNSQGEVTGRLLGYNCRAQEKVIQLDKLLGPRSDYLLYVYGDSEGDRQMLDSADYPFYRTFN